MIIYITIGPRNLEIDRRWMKSCDMPGGIESLSFFGKITVPKGQPLHEVSPLLGTGRHMELRKRPINPAGDAAHPIFFNSEVTLLNLTTGQCEVFGPLVSPGYDHSDESEADHD